MSRSPLKGRYDAAVDRESAFEMLQTRARQSMLQAEEARQAEVKAKAEQKDGGWFSGSGRRQGVGEALVKSAVRTIGTQLGREILRGVLGSIFGKKR
jgi:hypothetical protein